MYFVKRKLDFYSLSNIIRFYSLTKKSHYDVLKLRKNCSDRDIKEAFIKLSKEYHPDKNKDSAAQAKFVQIVEAYNVLGKPNSRAQYDSLTDAAGSTYVYKTHVPYNIRRNQYSYNYENQSNKSQGAKTENNSFYGMNGIKKVPNYVIIMMCCGLALVGCLVQIFVIREMYVVQRQQAHERSKFLAEELEKVRAAAKGKGNDVQSRLLLEKIVTAANPTVATASLGQALANEKKETDSLYTDFVFTEIISDDLPYRVHHKNAFTSQEPEPQLKCTLNRQSFK